MTSDNISKVVATIGEDELENVLDVPVNKRKEFRQQGSTTADYRQRFIDHFIKYSHWAGWSNFASRLYRYEQPAAVEAARAFITQTPEPSLSLANLTTLLKNINIGDSRRWWSIGYWLNIPRSKLNAIKGQHSSPDQCSRACWDLYVSEHPSPSWKGVAYALYEEDLLEELEVVQMKYLKDINLQNMCLEKLSNLLKGTSDIDTLPLPTKFKDELKHRLAIKFGE